MRKYLLITCLVVFLGGSLKPPVSSASDKPAGLTANALVLAGIGVRYCSADLRKFGVHSETGGHVPTDEYIGRLDTGRMDNAFALSTANGQAPSKLAQLIAVKIGSGENGRMGIMLEEVVIKPDFMQFNVLRVLLPGKSREQFKVMVRNQFLPLTNELVRSLGFTIVNPGGEKEADPYDLDGDCN